MADITKTKPMCGTSSTSLATGGPDDFEGSRRHLWKQRMIGPDNGYIKLTRITHTKLIVVLWCMHLF